MNYWFTTDLHMGHDREFIWKTRGFSSIKEHDEAIIDSINYYVKKADVLYILGDVAWTDPFKFLRTISNCKVIVIIKGNHDKNLYSNTHLVPDSVLLKSTIEDIKIDNDQPIVLSHYPMLNWNASHYGSWNLYGHVHGKELPIKGKQFDVVPIIGHIQPYEFEEIKEIMATKPNNWDQIVKEKI